jgi:hypothetical protein
MKEFLQSFRPKQLNLINMQMREDVLDWLSFDTWTILFSDIFIPVRITDPFDGNHRKKCK